MSEMTTMTLDEFKAAIKGQGVPIEQVTFRCPSCKTLQCANDLIAAGAGKDFDEVQKYLGFTEAGADRAAQSCQAPAAFKAPVAIQDEAPAREVVPVTPKEVPRAQEDPVLAVLQDAHAAAQRALEAYVESVCDRHTLAELRAAVERTAAAVQQHRQ